MSWTRIFIHLVFSTKNRTPFLSTSQIRREVFDHIKQNSRQKGILLDCVNGYHEHAHCLLGLKRDQSISQIAQLIKGESSFWINRLKLISEKFIWQDDYWAVSISESHVQALRNYIYTQEEHHSTKSFQDEYDEFLMQSEDENPLPLA